jgi:hypothetical protein
MISGMVLAEKFECRSRGYRTSFVRVIFERPHEAIVSKRGVIARKRWFLKQ